MLCRASRKAQRVTLETLSTRTGYHASTLSKFENGRFNWDHAEAYYINVLNGPERQTYDALKKGAINGR